MKHDSPGKLSSSIGFGMNIIMDLPCNGVGVGHHGEEMRNEREKKTSIQHKSSCNRREDVAS